MILILKVLNWRKKPMKLKYWINKLIRSKIKIKWLFSNIIMAHSLKVRIFKILWLSQEN